MAACISNKTKVNVFAFLGYKASLQTMAANNSIFACNNLYFNIMKKGICKIIGLLAVIITLFSECKSNSSKADQDLLNIANNSEKKDTAATSERVQKIKGVFYNIPSALEIGQLLKESGADYSESFPSDPTSVSKYSSQKGQALNLGIYAADLSYAGIYEQKEEAMLYLKCANKLATSLGIPDAFGESTISRINANMDNQDSLLNIITQDYWNTDSYLQNSDRQEVSAFIMAGGWIEGLYLATQIASHSSGNDELINRVAEQKLSLSEVKALIDTYPNDANMQDIKNQLKQIQDAYADVNIENTKSKVSTDASKNTSTLGGNEKVMMTPEQFKKIADVTASVRNKIIQEY